MNESNINDGGVASKDNFDDKVFGIAGNRLIRYSGSDEAVEVPYGVTSVAKNAFGFNKHLIRRVILPQALRFIESGAFGARGFKRNKHAES